MGPSLPQIPVNKLDNQIISWKQKPPNELNKTQTPQCFIIHQILEVFTIIIKKWQHPKDTIDVNGRMVAVLPWKQWLINHRIWYRWAGRRTMTRGRKLITWGDFFFLVRCYKILVNYMHLRLNYHLSHISGLSSVKIWLILCR